MKKMKPHVALPLLIGFLSGLTLDILLSQFLLDCILFGTVVVTACVALAIAHYRNPNKKKLPARKSPLKIVKSRKVASSR